MHVASELRLRGGPQGFVLRYPQEGERTVAVDLHGSDRSRSDHDVDPLLAVVGCLTGVVLRYAREFELSSSQMEQVTI